MMKSPEIRDAKNENWELLHKWYKLCYNVYTIIQGKDDE